MLKSMKRLMIERPKNALFRLRRTYLSVLERTSLLTLVSDWTSFESSQIKMGVLTVAINGNIFLLCNEHTV